MVQMAVGQEDTIQAPEPEPTAQQLALCTLAAVNEETVLLVQDHRRRQPTMDRRCGGRGTQENKLKHGII